MNHSQKYSNYFSFFPKSNSLFFFPLH